MFKTLLFVSIAKHAVTVDVEPFIVGGKPISIKEYSHSAVILIHISPNPFACGSSVLNQNIVLSAAHCFDKYHKGISIWIRAGSEHKVKGTVRRASRICVHKNYNRHNIDNDIAVAYVKKPFQLSDYIKKVALMKRPPRCKIGIVAGWGLIDDLRLTETRHLHRAKQSLMSRGECSKVLRSLPMGTLCGDARNGKEYAAPGDSGSALVVKDYIKIGLLSFKISGITKSLVVYTDVSYFYNWIMSSSRLLHCFKKS